MQVHNALVRAGYKCQVCSSIESLHVHHNTYDNLGDELPTDLIVLCDICHGQFHDRLPKPPYYWLRIAAQAAERIARHA
jgi:5-methylcytosine-specific restriction endonuclease McrA